MDVSSDTPQCVTIRNAVYGKKTGVCKPRVLSSTAMASSVPTSNDFRMNNQPDRRIESPKKLRAAGAFEPCLVEDNDELYRNGIFEFNITRLVEFIANHADRFPIEKWPVASIIDYGGSRLNHATIATADLLKPVLLAEIAPSRFSLIDGHHRVARARSEGLHTIPAYRIYCPDHVPFLTSLTAYRTYIEYWNDKVNDLRPKRRRRF